MFTAYKPNTGESAYNFRKLSSLVKRVGGTSYREVPDQRTVDRTTIMVLRENKITPGTYDVIMRLRVPIASLD